MPDDKLDDKLTKYLEITSERVSHHGRLLWQEEQHYTWWVYILFAALATVLVSESLGSWRIVLIVLVSGFGIIVSFIGCKVIRTEGRQLHHALAIQESVLSQLGLSYVSRAKATPNKTLKELLVGFAKTIACKKLPENEVLGIRDYFQLTLIVATVLFILFDCIAILILTKPSSPPIPYMNATSTRT
jgi:hypothetical protein